MSEISTKSKSLISSILTNAYLQARVVKQHSRAVAISEAHDELTGKPLFEPVNHQVSADKINAKMAEYASKRVK